jgi:hypothetical protein
MNKILIPFLLLITGFFLPLTLQGQTEKPTSSIVGQGIMQWIYNNMGLSGTIEIPVSNAEAILIADGDTLQTQGSDGGIFTYSGISARNVTLSVTIPDHPYSFSGSFELMPGENIVLVPIHGISYPEGFPMQASEEPLIEMDGNTWTYYYPTFYNNTAVSPQGQPQEPDGKFFIINKLKELPGVEFNKRRGTLTISGPAVHKTFVNGAYIFGLNPEASE